MNKRFLVLFLGLLAVPLVLNAQTTNSFQVVSFDIGYAPGWVFDSSSGNNPKTPQMFALNVKVADRISVGFQTYTEKSTALPMLNMKYEFLPGRARGTLAFGVESGSGVFLAPSGGSSNLSVAALGFEYAPFSRNVAGSVTTELKLSTQYLFDTAKVSSAAAVFCIAFGIGL